MESLSASHQKTPNVQHAPSAGPPDWRFGKAPSAAATNSLEVEVPRTMIINDTSSSSSNNADSNTVSGDPSDSSFETAKEKQEYRATATSAKKEELGKRPGAEQILVVKQFLGHDQENKNAPYAVTQLREQPKRQQSCEFPFLGLQRASDNVGVIWNLDTPLAQTDPQQPQNANMPPKHVSIPACSGGMAPASSTFQADPGTAPC
ncbi:g8387 [Coccomyxa elongata]